MRRLVRPAVVLALLPSAFLVAPSADAASPVKISYVHYDSKGSDTGSNTSLNDEYVKITNTASGSRSISGWTLKDRTGYTYRFPTFTLKAGASVIVHTGKGTSTSWHRYYGRTWYVWNNSGDTAYLRSASGALVDTCSWSAVGTGGRSC